MEIIKEKLNKIKEEGSKIKKEVFKQTMSYIAAAFAFVAGLAWNEAIKSLIEYLFPLSQNTLLAKLIYAVLITLVVVIITIYLLRLSPKEKKEKN